ncbi:hypothetical protein [Streptomyces olivaceus]|uniref:hypothetical protein n=1 Tax=Streptomyces olivaceus TaxID=47716 RepID=UPI00362A064E
MTHIGHALSGITWAFAALYLIWYFTGRDMRQMYGLGALANGFNIPAAIISGTSEIWALLSAAMGAWMTWLWWHSGGGDGPRRRLRRLAGRFTGVRRTAPTTN